MPFENACFEAMGRYDRRPKMAFTCQLITAKLAGILAPASFDNLLVLTVLEAECSLFLLEGFIGVFYGSSLI